MSWFNAMAAVVLIINNVMNIRFPKILRMDTARKSGIVILLAKKMQSLEGLVYLFNSAIEVPKRNLPLMKSASRPNIYANKTNSSISAYANTTTSSLAQEALNTIQKRKNTTIKVDFRKNATVDKVPKPNKQGDSFNQDILVPKWSKVEDKPSPRRSKRQCTRTTDQRIERGSSEESSDIENLSDSVYRARLNSLI